MREQKDLQIIKRRVDDLIPYARNQKKHDERQVKNLANSLKRFGWGQAVLIDSNDVIVAGHGRVLAAKQLGLEYCPCLIADDMSEDEVREYRIADNKLNESDWDNDALQIDLAQLDFDGFDFDFKEFSFIEQDEFDESNLDENVEKTNVCITINCPNADCYEQIKERLQNLADQVSATIAVKMA